MEHYLIHLPKLPKCDACQTAKVQFRQSRRADPEEERVSKFGAIIILDHVVILHPGAACFEGMADADSVVVKDHATGWTEFFPNPDKSTDATAKAIRTFLAPGAKALKVWGDGSGENMGACGALDWPLQQSTLQACLEGTRTILE